MTYERKVLAHPRAMATGKERQKQYPRALCYRGFWLFGRSEDRHEVFFSGIRRHETTSKQRAMNWVDREITRIRIAALPAS